MLKALFVSFALLWLITVTAVAQGFPFEAGKGGKHQPPPPPANPQVYLSAIPTLLATPNGTAAVDTTIPNGSSALLTWDSTNTSSCTGTGFSTGGAVSGTVTVSPTVSTTYSVTCNGKQVFANVTVSGNLINAATTYCAANGGGTGSSASPWQAACINAAVAAASNGDTVFLAAGNWVLPIATSAGAVIISSNVNLVGAGSNNSFSATGGLTNVDGTTPCPTASASITCIYPTGTRAHTGPGGIVEFNGSTHFQVAHIFFDSSLDTAGGGPWAILSIQNTNGPALVSDIHVLSYNDSTFTQEAVFFPFFANNVTVQNSVFAAPLYIGGGGVYTLDGVFQANNSNNLLVQNSSFWEGGVNPIAQDGTTMVGNVFFQGKDGSGNGPAFAPAVGWAGAAIGPGTNSGYSNGSNNWTATNNYFNVPGVFFSLGGGTNDPGGGGGNNSLSVTGNTLGSTTASTSAVIDSCIFHYYTSPGAGQYSGCSPGVVATSATWGSAHVTFVVPNTPNTALITASSAFRTAGFLPVGYNGIWTATSASCAGGSCTIAASQVSALATPATTLGDLASSGASEGMQINGTVQNDCSEANSPTGNFTITNNSIIATVNAQLVATGTGIINCYISPSGPVITQHNNTVVNFNASKNYLSSPNNLYLTDTNTINPSVSNNFCSGSSSGFPGCATSGFTTLPTCTFSLGTLSNGMVLFANTQFTAQYGAVQWIASTSSTTPLSSDTRWSYVPPVSLASVAHGNTIYMWVMDSNNNISAPASALLM